MYSWIIQRDKNIRGTLVRNSTVPEELGRIEYLLSDKTGTLTKNEMVSLQFVLFTSNIFYSCSRSYIWDHCHILWSHLMRLVL